MMKKPRTATELYLFYVVSLDGEKIVWTNLTELQASRLNKATENHAPSNILKFGWARMPTVVKDE